MSASCTSPGSLASNPPVRRGAPGDDQAGDLSASASVLIEVVPLESPAPAPAPARPAARRPAPDGQHGVYRRAQPRL